MNLVQESLSKGDSTSALDMHISLTLNNFSFMPKDKLREIDKNSSERLESLLIDLPIHGKIYSINRKQKVR